ncbi:vacuolar membrane protein-domain-containing protein [Roridomyces roridus]|uniref:Vacuolar membrane protein-domain-containing protein n=1 Tax=Roridomyces roridus TaxID=1738132 RepID=A0AAD7C5I2_9AGAR|nr:vacuolar membrane protein-domain-containing protein [Roridomyces roridus]
MDDIDYPSLNKTSPANVFDDPDVVDTSSCRLLGPVALIVQALMGVLVILSLLYKRHREKPMRPWRIWLFDVSKQVVGQMWIHGVNVLVSSLVSHHSSQNACVSYFLNILIDTTLGVGLLYVALRVLTFLMSEKLQLKGFESGMYGTPPSFQFWLRQAAIYLVALTTMKFMVIGMLALIPGLYTVGAWLLSWTYTEKGDAVQVIFVMGIFPIIMNILQFWIVDSIVKGSGVALDEDAPDPLDREPLFRAGDDDDDDTPTNVHTQTDIESHPRTTRHARSLSPAGSESSDKLDKEPKHSNSSTPSTSRPMDIHAYPPNLSSSAASSASSHAPVLREAKKLKPKRRSPPSPLEILTVNQPAVNSPGPTPNSAPAPARTPAPVPAPVPKPTPPEEESWGDSWDDGDDWANKVGEEEWTGRRMEEKRGILNSWDSPLVNSVH